MSREPVVRGAARMKRVAVRPQTSRENTGLRDRAGHPPHQQFVSPCAGTNLHAAVVPGTAGSPCGVSRQPGPANRGCIGRSTRPGCRCGRAPAHHRWSLQHVVARDPVAATIIASFRRGPGLRLGVRVFGRSGFEFPGATPRNAGKKTTGKRCNLDEHGGFPIAKTCAASKTIARNHRERRLLPSRRRSLLTATLHMARTRFSG